MDKQKPTDNFAADEIDKRRDDALRRALNTPHTPHKPIGKKKASPVKGKLRKRKPA